jgi:tetratricopeptide (TPR) repeat protein
MMQNLLGPYRIVKPLGTGGMAAVYQAQDTRSGAVVAVKQILPHIAADQEFIKRFIHETKVMMQLSHPNILPILDAQLGPIDYYIVMPLLDRGTLKEILQTVRRLPADFAVFVVQEMLKALDHAHMKGVIHRDLKPANIMFDSQGHMYLMDFGVARVSGMTQLTATGEVLGTPAYMAPEQALGMGLSPATDLFSMGTIFYELLTGVNPFITENPVTTMRQVVELQPPALMDACPLVPAYLEPVVFNLMRKKPEERYSTAIAASEDLIPYWEGRNLAQARTDFFAFLSDPMGVLKTLHSAQARAKLEHAKAEWEIPEHRPVALWEATQASALDPTFEEAKVLLERWSRLMGTGKPAAEDPNIARAEEKWRQAPENVQLLLQLGKLYRVRKNYIGLMRVFQRLERLNPTDSYTIGQMKSLLDRPAAMSAPAPVEQKAGLLDILKSIPKWAYLILAMVAVVALIGRVISKGQESAAVSETLIEAVSVLDQAHEIQQAAAVNDPDIRLILEKETAGDTEGAYQSCLELLESIPPHPQVNLIYWKAGTLALKLGKKEEAAGFLIRAYERHQAPERWQIAFSLAQLHASMGQSEKAEYYWERIIESGMAPHSPRALLERAAYLIKKDMVRPARQDLEQIVKDYPDSPEATRAQALLNKY